MPKAVPKEVQIEPHAVSKSSPAKAASAAVKKTALKTTKAIPKTSPAKTASDTNKKSSREKKKCRIFQCTNLAIREGVCWRHGAKELILGKQSNSGAQQKGKGQQANTGIHHGEDTKTVIIPALQPNEKLGIFVKFNAQEYKGALVTGINKPVCRFSDQIEVGDRIVTNNGKLVKSLQDLKPITGVGTRRFEVVSAAVALSQLPMLTSLMKDQVINQVATYMVQRNISIANWSLVQAQFFTAATRDFPFLTSVAWEVECKKVRDNSIHAAAQYSHSQMNQQAAAQAQHNPSLEKGFEEWMKLHSEKTKPIYDFSKGGKERREQYKKARKEQRDADNAAETLKAIANGEDPSPPKPKRKKVEVVVGNPYERKFIRTTAKGRRSSVSRRAATEGVGAVDEGGTSANDNGELADNGEDNNTSTPASGSATKRADEAEEDAGEGRSMTESPKKYQIRSDDEDDNDEVDDDDDGADDDYGVDDDSSEEWKPSSKKKYHKITFEERLKLCHAFKVEHGHLNILAAKDEYGLASWAKIIRRNYRLFLSGGAGVQPARLRTYGHELEILEEMGFDFGSPDNDEGEETNNNEAAEGLSTTNRNTRMIWDYRIEQCRQFKAANNGQMNISDHDKVLGMFASRMRSLYNDRLNGTRVLSDIEKEKVGILEGLGFCFDGNFDANLERFREYKQRTGKSKVPSIFKPGEGIDKELVGWARTVRYDNNRMNRGEKSQYLTSDRLRKLVRVGFDFGDPPKKEAPWEEMFESLSSYRAEHGKDPPISHEKLGYWVTKQRAAYLRKADGHTKHNMSDEREEKLRSIGFIFRAGRRLTEADKDRLRAGKQKSFDDKLAEFIAWKEKHGHPYVPRDGGEDHHLGKWVVRMRQAYKNYTGVTDKKQYGKLTAEQALKLTQAGFAFDASHRWTKSTVKKTDDYQESEEQNEPEWHNYEHHHADPFV